MEEDGLELLILLPKPLKGWDSWPENLSWPINTLYVVLVLLIFSYFVVYF